MASPVLVVVSGPAGSGKTTLAHALARAIPCPAVCRDEIKEGMVHAFGGDFEAAPGDPLTMRTLPVFFEVLRLLLDADVTVVAEAAFQDKVWRPRLEPLLGVAEIRIVHCTVDPTVARERVRRRLADDVSRRAHADSTVLNEPDTGQATLSQFERVALPVPSITVDTTDGYHPSLADVVAFINAR